MVPGLYAAASGIMAIEDRQAVIANNIANASTVGFRSQQTAQKGFRQVFSEKLARPLRFTTNSAPGGGVKNVETYTSTEAGPLAATDDPLNVALSGPGYFVVDTPSGERYTRAGNFVIDNDGQLATAAGYKVEGSGGASIDARGGDIQIAGDGTVNVNGAQSGRLRVVEFEDPHMLTREGNGLYKASEAAANRSAEAEKTTVVGKTLEMSNVSLPKEMVNLIQALRAYEANQKVITATDETMSRLIEQVGAPS